MLSVFTSYHQKLTPDKIFSDMVFPEWSFCRGDDYTDDRFRSSEVDGDLIRTEFADTDEESNKIYNTNRAKPQ